MNKTQELTADATMLPWQAKVMMDPTRIRVIAAGRRSGKTYLMALSLMQFALENPDTRSVFLGKSNPSVRESIFIPFQKMIEGKAFIDRVNKSTNTVYFTNGSRIVFVSSENPDSLRGSEADYLVCDEIDYTSYPFMDMWQEILMPMISRNESRVILSSTPSGLGGALYAFSLKAQQFPDVYSFSHVTAYEAGNVKTSEIDLQRSMMSETAFAQEYLADFIAGGHTVYHAFSRENNVDPCSDGMGQIQIGLDFNFRGMHAVCASKVGDELHIFKVITVEGTNTQAMAETILHNFPNRDILMMPDPAGRQRKTSAESGITDHTILQRNGLGVYAPKAPYKIVDRVNTVNMMLRSADDRSRLYVDPSCDFLIEALEAQTYDEKTGQPMKDGKYDDILDSLGYLVMGSFPMMGRGFIPLQTTGLI